MCFNRNNNPSGSNQHRNRPILEDHPELPTILQNYINTGVRQKDMPQHLLRDHAITISLRSVQLVMKNKNIKTARRSGMDTIDQGVAILKVSEDDPLGRWGARLVKEKLAHKGVHIPRDFITTFRQAENPSAAAARHPCTRKVHHHGLYSSGPNEEWCLDGHEKILRSMGIAVWGAIDKCCRVELGLWAVPNARLADVPPALYLRLVRKIGGMCLVYSTDKGSELSKLIPLITTLRQIYQPYLSEEILPAHKAVKSIYNVTRERNWRPIWEKELGNVAFEYTSGKGLIGFHQDNPIHEGVALWLWGKIVQLRLDMIVKESQSHRVRKQAKSLLPTGCRRIDMYEHPEDWEGLENQLIAIPGEDIDKLLEKYDRPDLLQFGSDEMVQFCQYLFEKIGSPELSAKVGWKVFLRMLECAEEDHIAAEAGGN
ncbi:hypothetical protein BJ912DRAFT_855711 [Pholiota molesta]|nr:hypothetical protein BJ912DRAFT_855711 [Pholiota molesta]